MAKVTGDVSVPGLANLLHVLAAHRREGYLTIRSDGRAKIFRFSGGGFRLLLGSSRENPVGRILMRSTHVARGRLNGLLAAGRLSRRPLEQLAVRQGLLTPDQLERALRDQVAEEICELFTWRKATFEIADEADAPALRRDGPLARVAVEDDLTTILFEAARRADDMKRIETTIPDRGRIPHRLRNPSLSGYRGGDGDAVREILSLVDGRRSVAEIIDRSLFPEYTVLRTLHELALAGLVRIRPKGAPAPLERAAS